MLMSMMSSLNISIRKKLMLMLVWRLSSLAHKLLMLMFMLMLASLVRTWLYFEKHFKLAEIIFYFIGTLIFVQCSWFWLTLTLHELHNCNYSTGLIV